MAKMKHSPMACVTIASVMPEKASKMVHFSKWRPWLLDLRALDMRSPAWLRQPDTATMAQRCELGERFLQHAVQSAREKAKTPSEAQSMVHVLCSEPWKTALLSVELRFPEDYGPEEKKKAEKAFALGLLKALGSLRTKKSPAARVWSEAPQSCLDVWMMQAMGYSVGERAGVWAEEMAACLESARLGESLKSAPKAPVTQKRL